MVVYWCTTHNRQWMETQNMCDVGYKVEPYPPTCVMAEMKLTPISD